MVNQQFLQTQQGHEHLQTDYGRPKQPQSRYKQSQPGYVQPQIVYVQPQPVYLPPIQYQVNVNTIYALGPNQQVDFHKYNRIKELENRLDKGCFMCFKFLLWMSVLYGLMQIFIAITYGFWFSMASGLISFCASLLTLNAMRNKTYQDAHTAFVLVLIQTIFIGLNLYFSYQIMAKERFHDEELQRLYEEFPNTCVGVVIFHLFVTILGTYKVRQILEERKKLKIAAEQ